MEPFVTLLVDFYTRHTLYEHAIPGKLREDGSALSSRRTDDAPKRLYPFCDNIVVPEAR